MNNIFTANPKFVNQSLVSFLKDRFLCLVSDHTVKVRANNSVENCIFLYFELVLIREMNSNCTLNSAVSALSYQSFVSLVVLFISCPAFNSNH